MLSGKNLIAGDPVGAADGTFTAGGSLAQFEEASSALIDRACDAAARAFDPYRRLPASAPAPPVNCACSQRWCGMAHGWTRASIAHCPAARRCPDQTSGEC